MLKQYFDTNCYTKRKFGYSTAKLHVLDYGCTPQICCALDITLDPIRTMRLRPVCT